MTLSQMFGTARFVGADECSAGDIFVLRAHFTLNGVQKATLRVLGLGFFHCYLNGRRVGDELFLPLDSEYGPRENFPTGEQLSGFRTYVPEYDVTHLLQNGENILALHFGGGWYTFPFKQAYGLPKAIWRLFGEGADGAFDFGSSPTDKLSKSFVSDYYFTRREQQDYTLSNEQILTPDFNDTPWPNAALVPPVQTEFYFSDCPADAVCEVLPVRALGNCELGRVFACDKNTTGTPVLRLRGKRGETVRIIFSEELDEQGAPSAKFSHKQELSFVCDGTERTVRALFTWFAFRYFAVYGEADVICVETIYTNTQRISDFRCSNDTLNWLHDTYLNTQLTNMHAGIPSDCPHIERRGYTGDGQLACRSAMKMLETEAFYRKWMQDIADSQDKISGHVQNTAPYTHSGGGLGGWGCAIVEVPWQFYLHYGDEKPLVQYYPNMLRYLDYVELHSANNLVISDKAGEWCLGDWCCPTSVVLPAPFVNTYFYIKSMQRMQKIAALIGREADIPMLQARINACKKVLKQAYFNTWDGNFFGTVQGANAFAVDLELGDERTYANLVQYYKEKGEFDTGIFGTELLLRLLFERGDGALAVSLLAEGGVHSYAEMMRRGATTLWEHWPESYRDRSHNHPMFGSVVSHLYDYLLGIRQEGAGYQQVILSPVPVPQLDWVSGYRNLKTGRLSVAYEKNEGHITFTVTVPKKQSVILQFAGKQYALHEGENTLTLALPEASSP